MNKGSDSKRHLQPLEEFQKARGINGMKCYRDQTSQGLRSGAAGVMQTIRSPPDLQDVVTKLQTYY